jgi:hypothetical protein
MLNNFVQLQISCYTLNAVRFTLYSNTLNAVRSTLYFFMQNKPNLQNTKINVTSLLTKGYRIFRTFCRRKNKPNQTQFLTKNWLLFPNIGFVFHQKLL